MKEKPIKLIINKLFYFITKKIIISIPEPYFRAKKKEAVSKSTEGPSEQGWEIPTEYL